MHATRPLTISLSALIVNHVRPATLAPLAYRYLDPRRFVLTNRFDFRARAMDLDK